MLRRALLLLTALLFLPGVPPVRAAEKVAVRAAAHEGFGRIVFAWQQPVAYQARVEGDNLVIHFARAFSAKLDVVTDQLDAYIAAATLGQDGRTVVAKLKRPVGVKAFLVNGASVAIDLTPRGASSQPAEATLAKLAPAAGQDPSAAKPTEAAKPPAAEKVAVRAAAHAGFGRIAFDWQKPVGYEAREEGGDLVIHFARAFSADLDAVTDQLDAYVAAVSLGADGRTVVAKLKHPVTIKAFEVDGLTVAVDLIARGASLQPAEAALAELVPAAGQPAPGTAKPTVVHLRIGRPKGAEQVAFVWPSRVDYSFAAADGVVQLTFRQRATIDSAALAAALPGFAPKLEDKEGSTTLVLTVPNGMHVGQFRSGNEVVLEVTGKPPAGVAPKPPETAPAVTPPASLRPPADGAATAADVAAKPPGPAPADPPAAEDKPMPPPPASLVAHYAVENDHASLRFDWPLPTGAAVFRRGMALWIVFAAPTKMDLSELRRRGQPMVRAVEQLAVQGATALRLIPGDGINPSVRRAGNSWIIDLRVQPVQPEAPIDIDVRPSGTPPAVQFRVRQASAVVRLRDPALGDTLLAVPVAELGRGVDVAREFVDFRVLPSIEGVVVRANSDDLAVHIDADAVEITRPNGLLLSSERDRLLGPATANLHRLFDFAAWRGPQDQIFADRRSRLEQAIATAAPSARSEARLNLAHFYFAHLFDAETLSVVQTIEKDDPAYAADTGIRALKGAACVLAGDNDCAARELGRPALDNETEAALWRGALAASNGDWDTAARDFARGVALLPEYPQPLRNRFALAAAEAMLESDRAGAAGPLIDLVKQDPQNVADSAMALYLEGRRDQQAGQLDQALDLWTKAAAMGDRQSRARALYARAVALYDAGKASRSDTIKALDALRFSWRGGAFEFKLLRRLGEMEIADGDPGNGLELLREAATYFPDYPASKEIAKEMSDTFADLYLGKSADDLPPLKALVLYDQFHDVEPIGPRRDAIVRKLVDRLVAVDLLDRAASLLENQVKNRLSGLDKARAATQLALLRLMDRKPDAAIAALDIELDGALPVELLHQRQELRARALLDLKRGEDGLKILANDNSRDAERLRADIYWRARNWKEAAKSFQRLAGDPQPDAKLDPDMSRLVLNWAAALTLDGDHEGLVKLRATYGALMAGTPQADAFRIIANEGAGGVEPGADPREIANRVAQLGELQNFMAAYKARLANDKLSAIN